MQTDKRKTIVKKKKKESEVKVWLKGVGWSLNVETITVSKGYPVCRMSGSGFEIVRPTEDSHCSNVEYHSISFCNKGFLSGDKWDILTCLML